MEPAENQPQPARHDHDFVCVIKSFNDGKYARRPDFWTFRVNQLYCHLVPYPLRQKAQHYPIHSKNQNI